MKVSRPRLALAPPCVEAETEDSERPIALVRVMHLQALSPKVVAPYGREGSAVLHVLVVQDGQPVVEHKVARDAVEVAGQPDEKRERDDPARSAGATRPHAAPTERPEVLAQMRERTTLRASTQTLRTSANALYELGQPTS